MIGWIDTISFVVGDFPSCIGNLYVGVGDSLASGNLRLPRLLDAKDINTCIFKMLLRRWDWRDIRGATFLDLDVRNYRKSLHNTLNKGSFGQTSHMRFLP